MSSDESGSGGVKDMWDGNISSLTTERFDKMKEFMRDKGNHICTSCGSNMIAINGSGCLSCPSCGRKDCGE